MTDMKAENPEVVAIVKSASWAKRMEKCLADLPLKRRIVTAADFHNGQCGSASAALRLIIIETGDDLDFFREALTCIDAGFLQAGGPVIAILEKDAAAQEDTLLMMGASKVVDGSISAAQLRRMIAVDSTEYDRIKRLRKDIERRASAIGEVMQGTFRLHTRREAQNLATMLSLSASEPRTVAVGLSELIINGIEHGCLGIGHDEKGRLIESGALTEEIHHRRAQTDYAGRTVMVEFRRTADRLEFVITDPGEGFDYNGVTAEAPGDLKKHGRGILMARNCFDELEYEGRGNIVRAVHYRKKKD
ncbi:ATP-binding protein [Kordiimonas marina]|uniref:ATP-binding protein n=1 Tax=Kordiimonas marina TaxID=2872312 RepID=UPI001FF4BDFB|nr:ATP-binding protein [Kordiimonas marina]MCJ9429128.1 ATP-binding protein [Kordiimonas marina]